MQNFVTPNQVSAFLDYTTEHYPDAVEAGHMIAYGNLDKLDQNISKYNRFIGRKVDGVFVPDIERPLYHARTTTSPPPRAFGPLGNWNVASIPSNGVLVDSLMQIGNETLFSIVKPFQALPADEHVGLHTDDKVDHPHSFVYHPVRADLFPDSDMVATITSAVAWDASMRNLLPDNVNGICCVIRNSCDQTYTYEIDGKDAFFKGEGDR